MSARSAAWQAARDRRHERRNHDSARRALNLDDMPAPDPGWSRLMRQGYLRPLPAPPALHQIARRRTDRRAA